MSLAVWLENGWLTRQKPAPQSIQDLVAAAAADLEDAGKDLSAGWRFAIAYNAALRLCAAALAAEGYRATRDQKHYRTIAALPLTLGREAPRRGRTGHRSRANRRADRPSLNPVQPHDWIPGLGIGR